MPAPVGRKLRSGADFRRVLREGKAVSTPHLVVHAARRGDGDAGRYGLVVSKRVGNAVTRNRVRRQTRAAVEQAGGIPDGVEAVIVIKPQRAELRVDTLAREIWEIMEDYDGSSAGPGHGT